MENHKYQITNFKQISITKIPNRKQDIYKQLLFWSFEFRVWKLFACPVKSMRPYQGYLMLGVWYLKQ